MIMNILVIGAVLGIAYAWMVRGAFNSFLQALCVFFGGAVAFAVWEPVSMLLISVSPNSGFASALMDAAWGIGLVVPFVLVTLGLRVAVDKIIGANIKNSTGVDYAGGAVFGLMIGVLSVGMVVIGLSHMRLPTGFLGYQPVWYADGREGYLVESPGLWLPADTLTHKAYSAVSVGSMSTARPLAEWYPDLRVTGFASRISPGEGSGRNAIKPKAFRPLTRYIVGNENGSTDKSALIGQEKYRDIDNEEVGAAYLAGFVLEFGPEAKESGEGGGQVVVSNGQVRLLTRHTETGETDTVFPLATISESRDAGKYGRWVYDSEDVYITSTGGKSRVEMGFEFLVPADEEPVALYVRNMRVPVDEFVGEPATYADASARDRNVLDGSILKGAVSTREFDTSGAVSLRPDGNGRYPNTSTGPNIGEVFSSQIAKQRGLNINDDNEVVGGAVQFSSEEVGRSTVPGKSLRVEQFVQNPGQTIVRVSVGDRGGRDGGIIEGGLLDEGAKNVPDDEPLMLVDTDGNEYEAVGYVYRQGSTDFFIRFTPGDTLTGIDDLPSLSRSRTGQEMSIVFTVTSDVEIEHFSVGSKVLMTYDPPFEAD